MLKIGLSGRILGYFGALIAAALIGSVLLVDLHVNTQVRNDVRSELETSQRVLEKLLETRADALITAASLVSRSPVLNQAEQTWDPYFLESASLEVNRLVGSEVVLITDRMGVILGASDRRWEPGETFEETTSVARAVRGERAASLWAHERRLFQMVSVPLRLPTGLVGTLSVGFPIDDELARELSDLSGNHIAFIVGGEVIVSSRRLAEAETAVIRNLATTIRGAKPVFSEIDVHGKVPALVVGPFLAIGEHQVGAYAILRSLEHESTALEALEWRLVTTAAFALFAALGVGFIDTRSVTRPLTDLTVAARELGSGNYESPMPPPAGSVEVEELTRSFEAMRSSLKERVGELRELTSNLEEIVRQRTAALEAALAENRRLLETLQRWNDELERKVEARSRELADAQQMIIRQDRMAAIGRLAAGVAHEINNPLGILSGFAEGLLDRSRDPDLAKRPAFADFPDYLGLIVNEVERLKTIVQKFLRFARSRSPQKQRMDLNDVSRQVLDLLANQARLEGKRLIGHLETKRLEINADPEQLKQVLLNLTLNSLDAVARGGEVHVLTVRQQTAAELRVEDDGPGIPAELRARIFEPFFSTKPPEKGTGLGLSLCLDLVEQNGGDIELGEPPPEGGTSFVVRFALAGAEELRAHA